MIALAERREKDSQFPILERKMIRAFAIAAVSSLVLAGSLQAAVIVQYSAGSGSASVGPSAHDANATGGALMFDNAPIDLENHSNGLNTGRTYKFDVNVAAGYQLNVSDITFVVEDFGNPATFDFTDSDLTTSTDLGSANYTDQGQFATPTLTISAPGGTVLSSGAHTISVFIHNAINTDPSTPGTPFPSDGLYLGLSNIKLDGSVSATPEPASLSLLAISGLAMLRRRRMA